MLRTIATLGLLAPLCIASAVAQGDPMAAARAAAANQLGVMEYCQSQGSVDATAITAQRSVIATLPPGPAAADQAAEAQGKAGTIASSGNSVSLASFASQGHTTVDALCKQMASSVMQTSAAFRNTTVPGMPTMPAMPGGMPAMPGGMPTMPAMPGMTGTPVR